MATITTRAGKGSPLTNTEVDDNFSNLNSAKYESGSSPTLGVTQITGSNDVGLRVHSSDTASAINISDTGGSVNLQNYNGALKIRTNGTHSTYSGTIEMAKFSTSGIVFNDGSYDADFRVESNDNAHMLFIDAASNRVIVGAASGLTSTFNVSGNAQFANGTGNVGSLSIAPSNDRQIITANSPGNYGDYGVTLKSMRATGGSAYINNIDMTYQSTVLNEEGYDVDFRVESDSNANMFFVNAGDNRVEINSGGNDENISLLVSAGVTHLNGHRFIKAPAWNSWAVNTPYYLFTFYPASNGASGAATIDIGAGGVEHYAVFNLVARNASGTTTVAGYCTGASSSMFNLIGYRDNTDATKVHFYVKPTNNVYFTPTVRISGTGAIARYSSPPSSPVDEDYTFSSGTTYNHGLKAGSIHLNDNKNLNFGSSDDVRLYFDGTDSLYITATNGTADKIKTNANYTAIMQANGQQLITALANDAVIINEDSNNHDFRVESDSNANMLFVDGGANKVGIGTNSLGRVFNVYHPTTDGAIKLETGGNASNVWAGIEFKTPTSQSFIYIPSNDSTGLMKFLPASSEVLALSNSAVVVNEQSNDVDFRVESNGDDYAFFVDGGNDRVVVGSAGTDHANSKFVVVGRQTIYNGSSTGGSVLLTDGYNASNDDHLLNIGTQRSSGGPFISYGLGHNQNSDGLWKSTYDNFSGNHSVLVLNGATLEYHLDVSNSATTVGNTVAVKNGYKVGRSGTVFNDDGYSAFDFRVESDNEASKFVVDAGANEIKIGLGNDANSGVQFMGGTSERFNINYNGSQFVGLRAQSAPGGVDTNVLGVQTYSGGQFTNRLSFSRNGTMTEVAGSPNTTNYGARQTRRYYFGSSAFSNPTVVLMTLAASGSYPQAVLKVTVMSHGLSVNAAGVSTGYVTMTHQGGSWLKSEQGFTYDFYTYSNNPPQWDITSNDSAATASIAVECRRQTNYDKYSIEVEVLYGAGMSFSWSNP